MEKQQPLLHQDWYDSQMQWLNKNHISNITQVHSGHFVQLDQPQKVCNELQNILND